MALLEFQIPEKVVMEKDNDFYGKFLIRPLERGYGITLGNALRRVLLSSLEGYAISAVRIAGVDHEFSTINGVIEDVVDIILNLKHTKGNRSQAAKIMDIQRTYLSRLISKFGLKDI